MSKRKQKKKQKNNNGVFCNFRLVEDLLKNTSLSKLCLRIADEEDEPKYKKMYVDFSNKDWPKLTFNQKKCICTGLRFKLGIVEAYSTKMDRVRNFERELNEGFHRALNNHRYL
jgi:hypothetical protein